MSEREQPEKSKKKPIPKIPVVPEWVEVPRIAKPITIPTALKRDTEATVTEPIDTVTEPIDTVTVPEWVAGWLEIPSISISETKAAPSGAEDWLAGWLKIPGAAITGGGDQIPMGTKVPPALEELAAANEEFAIPVFFKTGEHPEWLEEWLSIPGATLLEGTTPIPLPKPEKVQEIPTVAPPKVEKPTAEELPTQPSCPHCGAVLTQEQLDFQKTGTKVLCYNCFNMI